MDFFILLASLDEDDHDFVYNLYLQHKDRMYYIALAILHNEHDAEDTVHEVMYKVIKYIDKFEGSTPDEIYNKILIGIRNIARNKSIDAYKKNKKRNSREINMSLLDNEEEDITFDPKDETVDIEKIIINDEYRAITKEALKKLPHEIADTVNLIYYEGYSSVEAADYLGITDVAVRARIFRARKKLYVLLKDKIDVSEFS